MQWVFPLALLKSNVHASIFQEAKGVLQSYSDLVDLFESIRGSLERRKPQPGLRPTPEIMEIRRKIMYEIITVLALAAGEMMQRRRRMFV